MLHRVEVTDNWFGTARRILQRRVASDGLAWAAGLTGASLLRYDFHPGSIGVSGLATFAAAALGIQVVVGLLTGLYLGRWRLGSFDEVAALARTVTWVAAILLLLDLPESHRPVPLSATVGGGLIAFILMGASRYVIRAHREAERRPNRTDARRLIVFGAGDAGAETVARMLRDPQSPYVPVALLDDDPLKRHLRIMGVPVAGGRDDLPAAAKDHEADTLLVAIPTASAKLVRELSERAHKLDLDIKVLPTVSELIDGTVRVDDMRTPTDADLLGRQPVNTDLDSIAHYLCGKRTLVTGAGGSIGSEICRQVARFHPASLIMLDRDESALHRLQLSLEGRALLDSPDFVLLDLRDWDGVKQLLGERRPEIIFHAAALKHLPLLERFPGEAVQSNVWATGNLLAAAEEVGVTKFVNISTDKAADPQSVLGYSKRIGERITAYFAEHSLGSYISVRFGNVLGSSGSALPAFRSQIASGGPVTVTHPAVSRYFMTVEEAVQLVIQAAVINGTNGPESAKPTDVIDLRDSPRPFGDNSPSLRRGEALVLDMGEPVRIEDVVRRLIEQTGRHIDIVYTGLRPGEKLNETLFGEGEQVVRRVHPLIFHVHVPPLDPGAIWALDPKSEPVALVASLHKLCLVPSASDRESPSVPDLVPSRAHVAGIGSVGVGSIMRNSHEYPSIGLAAVPATSAAHLERTLESHSPSARRLWGSYFKRLVDVVGAALALAVTLPVLLIVATLVRLQLGSPVFYRQPRLGRHERSFTLVKFRTMTQDQDGYGRLHPDAKRITPLGRFLRTTSLDELPELWSVLRGHMSLVGPRPLPVWYLRRYTPAERRRHQVHPGITGWAQINGRNSLGWDERLAHDIWYIDHQSLWLDLRILARTLAVWIRRSGIHAAGEATMTELRPSASLAPRGATDPTPRRTYRIPLSPPDIREPELRLLLAAVESGWVAPVGPDLDAFEADLAERCGVRQAVAVTSGTAALHLALLHVGVGPGDDVLVPTATFAATANAVTYCGGRPCFIDSDPQTWQMSPDLLASELADRYRRNTLPAAVVTVDLYGSCADQPFLQSICSRYGVPLVEDAAEALGATFEGRPAGSFGAAGVLSFNGNKIVTSSSGGALLCHDDHVAERARYLANQARLPVAHYEHQEVGFNYRLSNLLAAFGRGQLASLDHRIERRRAIRARYEEALGEIPGVGFQHVDPRSTSNAWLTCITLDPMLSPLGPGQLMHHLAGRGIEARPFWKPMHSQPVYMGQPARLDGTADRLFARGLCLPSGSGMTDASLDQVIEAVTTAFGIPVGRHQRRPVVAPLGRPA